MCVILILLNSGCLSIDCFKKYRDNICELAHPTRLALKLYDDNLITVNSKNRAMQVTGIDHYQNNAQVLNDVENVLKQDTNGTEFIIFCQILRIMPGLESVGEQMLQEIGIPVTAIPSLPLPSPVQQYCDIMKDKYARDPIIQTSCEWPPRAGNINDYFGRLRIIESEKTSSQTLWSAMRGNTDVIHENNSDKIIDVQNIFTCDQIGKHRKVVIDGPPGIGKTTLCRKICNLWGKTELKHEGFKLVLLCPLRDRRIARAKDIEDLLLYKCPSVSSVCEWIKAFHGDGVLIILDGWDELSAELKEDSLPAQIICEERLYMCSVIVTSRTYASSSLLSLESINRHLEVRGFQRDEIFVCIRGTLETELAEKLIKELTVRNDVISLCYIPFVCFLAIFVYKKLKGELPATITQLYEQFVLLSIKREIKKTGKRPELIDNLDNSIVSEVFGEICKLSYDSLSSETLTVTFLHSQIQQCIHDSTYLGLMTSFTDYDECRYEFLHLTIQEFLAAWWMTKQDNTEELFDKHWNNEHFTMCLRFVAGLTQLNHQSYQKYFSQSPQFLSCVQECNRPKACKASWFNYIKADASHRQMRYRNEYHSYTKLLYLLYESQNRILPNTLAKSCNFSLCLDTFGQLPFDLLCLTFFLKHTDVKWRQIHYTEYGQSLLPVICSIQVANVAMEMFRSTLQNVLMYTNICIQELYISDIPLTVRILVKLMKLPHLRVLHIKCGKVGTVVETHKIDIYRLKRSMECNEILQELQLHFEFDRLNLIIINILAAIIGGTAKNKVLQYLSLYYDDSIIVLGPSFLHNKAGVTTPWFNILKMPFVNLMKYNNTLQSLHLHFIEHTLTPLSDLDVSSKIFTFGNLYTLQIRDVNINVLTQLFTIAKDNKTLKNLAILTRQNVDTVIVCTALQNMLASNRTLETLRIILMKDICVVNTYTRCLITGLQGNSTLQCLCVPMELNEWTINYINERLPRACTHLKVLEVKLKVKSVNYCVQQYYHLELKSSQTLLAQFLLPLKDTLISNRNITKLVIAEIDDYSFLSTLKRPYIQLTDSDTARLFWKAVNEHPTLEYIDISEACNYDDYQALKIIKEELKNLQKNLVIDRF